MTAAFRALSLFRRATVRLTLWYLLLIMLLSAAFSVVLYRASTSELESLQSRQQTMLQQRSLLGFPGWTDVNQQRIREIEQTERAIAFRLLYFNLVILIIGGAASYLLAQRTLGPIEEALEEQKRFTADASHELRTPLTAMKTELEVALRDPGLTLAQSKELHESTLEEVAKLASLSNGLLTLAKQDGTSREGFQPCSLAVIVEDAVKRVAKAAKGRDIEIVPVVRDGTVKGDCWGLTEALAVLLDNAVKYSPKESVVEVEARLADRQAFLSVRDRGAGIKESDLPHIFSRFYRADLSRSKEKVEGYGLGLSIAKQIVDNHRGRIEVETALGKGSVFTIVVPT